MKNSLLADEWIKRALSNLTRAKAGKTSELIVFEDLVFDCQQAAEKALKSLLIYNGIEFPSTHSIARLIELLSSNIIDVPKIVQDSVFLTEYAVNTRYPGVYESVTESDYQAAILVAESVFNWVIENTDKEDIKDKDG